jgi:hypothetical protein
MLIACLSALACVGFVLMGSLSLHTNQAEYYRTHPTVKPTSVSRADNRQLCYVHVHRTDAARRPGGLCTQPPSDQQWCVTTACNDLGCWYDKSYYSWPAFCFKPVLTVRMGDLERTFTKDCGTSLDCAESFHADHITYMLGREAEFVIGESRYRPRPEEIAMLTIGGLLGLVAVIAFIAFCVRPTAAVTADLIKI